MPVISSLTRVNFRPTIYEEYKKIMTLLQENEKLTNKSALFEEKEKEKNLEYVINFANFLKVAFKSNRKELVIFACEDLNESLITPEIFEICLMNDEDIAIEVHYKAIDNDNVKECYMKVALIKKYFRLACRLLRFAVCKNFLSSQKFNDDERYVFVMNKFQIEEKKKFHIQLQKEENDYSKEVDESANAINEINIKKESILKEDLSKNLSKANDDSIQSNDPITNELIEMKSLNDINRENSNEMKREKGRIYKTIVNKMKNLFSSEVKIAFDENLEREKKRKMNVKGANTLSEKGNTDFASYMSNTNNSNNQQKETSKQNVQIEFLKNPLIKSQIDINDQSNNKENLSIKKSKIQSENAEKSEKFSNDLKNKKEFDIQDKLPENVLKEFNYEKLKNLTINVQLVLIDHLRWGQYTYPCLCLLSSIPERYLIIEYSEKICKSFMVFIRDEDAISKCRYPILLCVLAAEFLYKLGKIYPKYEYKCYSVAEVLLKLAECIQSSIKDEEMLNYYLRDQLDHNKRSALEIIAENRFYDLLKNENVASIVGKLWYGRGRDLSIWKYGRITRIISSNIRHEHYDTVISSERKNQLFSFQYNQYTRNCSVRYLVDSVSTILTTIFYQYIIYLYVGITARGNVPHETKVFKNINFVANLIVNTIILNQAMYLIYLRMTNRALKYSIFVLLDLIMFISVLCNFLDWPMSLFDDNDENHKFTDSVIYSIIIFCAWMRVIGILMTTRSYGPFLRTMYLILSTVINFIIFLFGYTTLFAQVFTILFKDSNSDFESFSKSWTNLFEANFGQFEYENFTRMQVFGYSLLMAYITIGNIMLLNLVIGIVNNLYNLFQQEADAENRAVLVLTYERIKWDEEFGLLILLPAPANILSVFFVIILLTINNRKSKEKWNNIFSKICYIIIAIGNFLLLLILSLLFFPLAYFKSLIHSAYDNTGKFKSSMLLKILLEISTRPAKLCYYIIEDSIQFWKLVYKNEEEIKEGKKSLINRDVIISLRKALTYFRYIKKKRFINLDDLNAKLGILLKNRFRNQDKTSSYNSLEASASDHSGDSNNKNTIDSPSHNEFNDGMHSRSNLNLHNMSSDSFINEERTLSVEEFNRGLKCLIEKIIDRDNMIDLERTLNILPERVKYSPHFINSLHYLSMRRVLRGLKTYFFLNTSQNPTYSFKKLEKIMNKILIKFKIIYHYLPESFLNELTAEKFVIINNDDKYDKKMENLNKLAEKDEFSDYEDEEESINHLISLEANFNSLKNQIENKTNTINFNERIMSPINKYKE